MSSALGREDLATHHAREPSRVVANVNKFLHLAEPLREDLPHLEAHERA